MNSKRLAAELLLHLKPSLLTTNNGSDKNPVLMLKVSRCGSLMFNAKNRKKKKKKPKKQKTTHAIEKTEVLLNFL